MKSIYGYLAGGLALTFGLAACIPPAATPPAAPAPAPSPVQTAMPEQVAAERVPTIPPTPPIIAENWLDQPQTVGDWSYGADPDVTIAHFGQTGETENSARFLILCDLRSRQVSIGMRGFPNARLMQIETEAASRTLNLELVPRSSGLVAVDLAATDPLLDAIALTRGRFAVAVSGTSTLRLPAWAEVTRVIEDCR